MAAVGIVAWGFQQGREWAEGFYEWWPLLLIWIGLGKLLDRRFAPGIGLITGGGLAFLHLRGLADFQYTWPLILVAVGVVITLGALMPKLDALDGDDGEHSQDIDNSESNPTGEPAKEADHGQAR